MRTTETREGKSATWRLVDRTVRVVRIRITTDASPAYLYPRKPLPSVQPGTVLFDDNKLPDLAQAREWFPEHDDLWNALRDDYWSAVLNMTNLPSTHK
ncbi:hypothetical protein IU459_05010 [Nocardia amamiensis]|uniref:Uncharacterized protein n=1 Tax=Nocardia amamiensis TaxID=404578 RepID=A0ABS0CJX8_9NOCA|nr:hypothetical protein [Nocardia amamiensis]MBF6296901.1 hypothetical protein [Nocardia amamiensis]